MGGPSTTNFDSPVENTDTKKKLTAAEIIAILEEKGISASDFGHGEFDSKELGLGESKEVHHEREGSDFDTMVKVEHFIDHDVYISVSGYYASHSGTEFDGSYQEVKPVQETVTTYQSVNS